MKEQAQAMVMASFVGDSLALGAHWIYSTTKIAKDIGRMEDYRKPGEGSYHPTKDKGEFTHYGDQAFVLLESLAEKKDFDLEEFSLKWREMFKDYTGYIDQATKGTLLNISNGASPMESGSSSNDIAGAARIAPLVYCLRNDPDILVSSARAQTAMTHRDPDTVGSSEFFARIAHCILTGGSPSMSITEVTDKYFKDTPIAVWVEKGIESKGHDSVETIRAFGQSCHTPDAFPGIIHLITKYEGDLKEALIQSVIAGGDSAARSMIVGMILGAHLGMEAIPEAWIFGLKRAEQIEALLSSIG
ncbi:MAG TPA: ADP-ribosylglycohydrolase family protein [Deltaproteobacteria bacterium]|nr:ADP-ribosylglycohydrolase family protein [Deltaproteobacteria bacterium]